jgi:hypothetical protein
MAEARMPNEFYDLVSHHLPPEQPVGPKGGRPPRRQPNESSRDVSCRASRRPAIAWAWSRGLICRMC